MPLRPTPITPLAAGPGGGPPGLGGKAAWIFTNPGRQAHRSWYGRSALFETERALLRSSNFVLATPKEIGENRQIIPKAGGAGC
jgi:hypothetical protein